VRVEVCGTAYGNGLQHACRHGFHAVGLQSARDCGRNCDIADYVSPGSAELGVGRATGRERLRASHSFSGSCTRAWRTATASESRHGLSPTHAARRTLRLLGRAISRQSWVIVIESKQPAAVIHAAIPVSAVKGFRGPTWATDVTGAPAKPGGDKTCG